MANNVITGFRISAQQERICALQGAAPFVAQSVVLLEGPLQPELLRQSLNNLIRRHEILRTVYHRQSGLKFPFQVILDHSEAAWNFVDRTNSGELTVDDLPSDPMPSDLTDRVPDIDPPVIDLEKGPLVHASLIALSASKHVLILSLPVLAADSSSLLNLVDELGRAYAAQPSLEDAGDEVMQYADIVQWQTDMLESEESKVCRDFWRDYSRKIDSASLAAIALPFETAQPSSSSSVAVHSEVIDSQQFRKLAAAAGNEPGAIETLLLSSYVVLIGRLTGQSAVILGNTLNGRKYDELAGALGLFAKDIPLEIDVRSELPFTSVLRQARATDAEVNQWQEGFSWSCFTDSRDQAGASLTLAFEYLDLGGVQTYGDLSLTTLSHSVPRERSKLKLSAVKSSKGLTLEFHHHPAHLPIDAVARIAGYYHSLLAACVNQPDLPIGDLPLLSEQERNRIVVDWNRTEATYPAECIQQLFEAQAASTPNRLALRSDDQALTYAQLNEAANQLAHYLRTLGVGPDSLPNSLVGLCVDRSTALMIAVLGILKAGGAYVPLNADNPKPRLAQQLVGATVLITEEKLLQQMPEIAGKSLCVDRDQALWASEPRTNPSIETSPDNLVYVLYTSGSTGTPKGVAVRHRNLVNYSTFITRKLHLHQHDQGLQFATVSTIAADLGNTCIYPALISGGCLHMISYDVATDAKKFAAYNTHSPIDVLKIVPSHLHALLQSSEAARILPHKYLITGGEALTPALVREIAALNPQCELLNHYGPTETTVGSLTLALNEFDWKHSTSATIPIGRPIANTQIYVLDSRGQLVPPGVTGELYITGDGVTAGYLNDPKRTAERFVSNPFVNDPAARMYRTGDLVRYLPDGNVEFLGRADDQVKIRGFRVELGEIEAVLAAHAGVKQAIVLAREDETGQKRLLAYAVTRPEAPSTGEDLRAWLKQHLPEHMVPSAFILLPKLPLTPNGKIDRLALPEPEAAAAKEYIAPRTLTEEVVSSIWAEVLHTDRIGARISTEDSFFDLGGHSLLATQVISRIRRALNVDLPLRTLFEAPTVAALAAQIDRFRRDPNSVEAPPITRVSRDLPLPLSFAQQRLWVLDQMEPNNPLYNIPRRTRLRGDLDIDALTEALNAIVRRHESQRTTFAVSDSNPVQVIAPSLHLDVPLRDLTALPAEAGLTEAKRIAAEEALIPFDLASGPLLRATLLKLAPDDHILLLAMHHIVSDAWSAGVFMQELAELYNSFKTGRPAALPELAIQYADYAAWQHDWFKGPVLEQHLAYWRDQLRGAPPLLQLPTDRPRGKTQSFNGFFETVSISGQTAQALRKLGQQEGVTLFMSLLAGFQTLLYRYSSQQQIVLGTDVANRPTAETERMIGFFINLLTLKTDLSGNPAFRELLARVRETALGAYAHQEMPFDKLVQELQPERSLSHNPIVQALFVMQNLPRQEKDFAGLTLEPFDLPVTRSKFDLAVFVVDKPEELITYWLYSTDLFEAATIQRMARHYEALLTDAVANPDARIDSIQFLSNEELAMQESEKQQARQSQAKKLLRAEPKPVQM